MHDLVHVTRYVNDVMFAVLALVAFRHWRRTGAPGSSWVAGAFVSLAAVAGAALLLPADAEQRAWTWATKSLVVLLLLFPYLLYRFAATFERPSPRSDRLAAGLTAAVAITTALLPGIPGPHDPRPSWLGLYIAFILVQWTALSSVVAVRLWRGGRGLPTVAGRRMRVLSVASVVLDLALVVGGISPRGRETWITVFMQLLVSGSAVLFYAGVAPPAALRRAWRRPEEDVLRVAQLQLMAATSPVEVADHLLPHVASVLGGRGAALVDHGGRIVGMYGVEPAALSADLGDQPPPVRVPLESGALLVWTSPQTPYFGAEELRLLTSFGVITDLALEKCRLIEDQRQREQRLAEAQRVAHVGSWEWDVVADRLTWSDELYRIFGLQPAELNPTYEGYLERIHPDDRGLVDDEVNLALHGDGPDGTEYRIIRPSGEVVWLRVRREVVLDAAGSPVLMRGTLHDITEEKRLDEALRQASGRYRLLQVMAVAANEAERLDQVLQVAVDQICAHTGWAAGHVWEIAEGDEPGLTPRPIWHLGDDQALQVLPSVVGPPTSLATGVLATADPAWGRCTSAPLVDLGLQGAFAFPVVVGGRVSCVLEFFATEPIEPNPALVETITQVGTQLGRVVERQAAVAELAAARDDAMESSRLKSEFLATMSHEIRTPMNGVIGLTSLLLGTDLDAQQRRYAEGVEGAGQSLLAIINDILDFSKIEAHKLVLEVTDFDMVQVVEETAALVAESAKGKGLALTVSFDPHLPGRLCGDPGRLRQVLLNLTANAVKFTDQGQVAIRVRAVSQAENKVLTRFEVADTGIGIADADRHRIFEPFRQADASTTRRYGGTGLGLAICSHLVGAMGGQIGVDSEPGEGSTFWFTVPLERAAATLVPPAPWTADAAAPAPGPSARLLVVEDNAVNQLVAVAMLRKLGYGVDVAANGLEALDAMDRTAYAAVLMDCQMPEMDGYEATAAIRRRTDAARRTPVIAMTAGAMEGDQERCIAAGMDDYLAKPITSAGVQAALNRWVRTTSAA